MQYWSAFQPTWYAVCSRCSMRQVNTTHLPPTTVRPHRWCVGDSAQAARPRTRSVQNRGANFQSASWQRATTSGTYCHCHWPTGSASYEVSKYQLPSRATHQAVYCWQPCFSSCRSSSLEWSVADYLQVKCNFTLDGKRSFCVFEPPLGA